LDHHMVMSPEDRRKIGFILILISALTGVSGFVTAFSLAPMPDIAVVLIALSVPLGVYGVSFFLRGEHRTLGIKISIGITVWAVLVTVLLLIRH